MTFGLRCGYVIPHHNIFFFENVFPVFWIRLYAKVQNLGQRKSESFCYSQYFIMYIKRILPSIREGLLRLDDGQFIIKSTKA